MKILHEWIFVGYGIEIDTEENGIGYVIAHPRPDESLEEAVERAKESLMKKYKERLDGSRETKYWQSSCNKNGADDERS